MLHTPESTPLENAFCSAWQHLAPALWGAGLLSPSCPWIQGMVSLGPRGVFSSTPCFSELALLDGTQVDAHGLIPLSHVFDRETNRDHTVAALLAQDGWRVVSPIGRGSNGASPGALPDSLHLPRVAKPSAHAALDAFTRLQARFIALGWRNGATWADLAPAARARHPSLREDTL